MSVAAVVVAAGRGVRFGAPKQFHIIGSETVSATSVRTARSVASQVILVVPADYEGDGEGADVVVGGGATRADSVRAGLDAVGDASIVVVHDAARPLASPALFASVVDAVRAGADAAIPALAVTDTIKRVAVDGSTTVVTGTISRDQLVTVQTPQAFRRDVLERAHAGLDDATDDAALVEALGGRVVVVPGETSNVKITVPSDLVQVAAWHEGAQ
jgi:2-C-methyl-D-erythritol 4-phosphate cytidylyltransferase